MMRLRGPDFLSHLLLHFWRERLMFG
jgi:hypothetical protein